MKNNDSVRRLAILPGFGNSDFRSLVLALKSKNRRKVPGKPQTLQPPSGVAWHDGDKVVFQPRRGASRKGVVKFDFEHRRGYALVQLQGDPYPVYISEKQIEREIQQMPVTKTTKKATKGRKSPATRGKGRHTSGVTNPVAANLVAPNTNGSAELPPSGYERLARARKATATKRPAKKAPAPRKAAPVAKKTGGGLNAGHPLKKATKKAPAAKKVTRRVTSTADRPLENPFRPQSNSWHYVEALKKGGKRSTIVRGLLKKIDVHPWRDETYDDPHNEVDKRLTMVVKELENKYGWTVERRGRGSESFVKITPPTSRPTKRASKARKS